VSTPRPDKVGDYELLQDFENTSASIRIIRMAEGVQAVDPHVHQRSAQMYVCLEGTVAIELDGVETTITPYGVVSVPVRSLHSARPVNGPATVMNISVPPLAASDQAPFVPAYDPADMRLPERESDDLED
jgi:mannose-6-phosphate isomerase-like protein (cupin superfamily)